MSREFVALYGHSRHWSTPVEVPFQLLRRATVVHLHNIYYYFEYHYKLNSFKKI